MTIALVDFVVIIAFAIVVKNELSFVCRVEMGFDGFFSFSNTVAFVAFDFIFFVGEVEVGFDVVVSFPLL